MTAAALPYLAAPASGLEVVQQQHGVLSGPQLAVIGVDADDIDVQVAAHRWQVIGRRVVVLHNTQLTVDQRRWAAVLMLEQPVALAAATAASDAGLAGFDDERVHLVVHRACDATFPDWVVVHNSRRFSPRDIDAGALRPRTRITRSLIDLASWSSTPRRACAVLCAGVQQRVTRADRLATELKRAGRVKHAAIMRAVLGDIGGGGHTLAELDLAPLARRAGLGAPRRQVLRREPGGRARYVDAEFDLPDGQVVAVEIDGAVHLKPLHWWDDLDRQNEIAIAGRPLLRFASVTLRLDEERVVDALRRMRESHPAPPSRLVIASPAHDPWSR